MNLTSAKTWWKSRPARLARATVATILALWATYIVLVNVFLSTSLFDTYVNGDPVTLEIHYARAWSVWPGAIHAKNLSIRSSDSNVMWNLTLDQVNFDVSFLALPHRRFQIDHARGRGASMRVQQKLNEGPQSVDDVSSLAPVPGYPAWAMAPAGPHHPELWDDSVYKLVTVQMDDTIAEDVREIWVNDMRFTGHARIAGSFYLKPIRAVEIGPIHVDISSGELNKGMSRMLAQNLGGSFDVTATLFDPRMVHDNEALRYFDVTTDLHAQLNDLAKMPFAMPAYVAGVIDAQKIGIHIEKGHLAPGTDIEASTPRLLAAKDNRIGYGQVALHAIVDDERRLQADVRLTNSEVIRPDNAVILASDALTVRADAANLDLAGKTIFDDVHVQAEIGNARVADARLGNCILPCTVRLHSGSATLNGLVELWPNQKRAAASATLAYENIDASMPNLSGRGSGQINVSFGSWQWDTGILEGVVVEGNFRDAQMKATDMHAKMPAGTLALRVPRLILADPMAALDASFVVDETDIEVTAGKNTGGGHVNAKGSLTLVDRKVASFDADVQARGGSFDGRFGDAHATAKNVSGTAKFAKDDNVTSGHVNLVVRGIGVQKGKLDAVADATIALNLNAIANDHLSLGTSKMTVTDAKGTLDGKSAFTAARVDVEGRTRNLDLESPDLKAIDAHVAFNDVAIPNAAVFQALISPKSKLRITSGSATLNGDIVLAGKEGASGNVVFDAKRAGLAVEKSTLVADANLQAKINGYDPETSTIDLSGTHLALRDVEVDNAAAEAKHWNGDLVLDKTEFSWADGTPSLATDIDLRARDAKPIVGMLLRDHAPGFLAKLATMTDLKMRGHLDADPDAIVLSDFFANGGDVAMRGAYAIRDGKKEGAFVVAKGGVSVGLRIGDDGAHPKLFGLDQWIAIETKKVKTAPKTDK